MENFNLLGYFLARVDLFFQINEQLKFLYRLLELLQVIKIVPKTDSRGISQQI